MNEAMIPLSIVHDRRMNPGSVLIYAEIVAYCLRNKTLKCKLKNAEFEGAFDIRSRAVDNWLGGLKKVGYIETSYERCNLRTITITDKETIKLMHRYRRGNWDE